VRTVAGRVADVWIAIGTALTILALTIPVFLTPVWVSFEQGRAQATAWTGFSDVELRTATESILSDLVIGPPDFDVQVAGVPVLDERERSHMRDVRGVFIGFFALSAIVGATAIVLAGRRLVDNRRDSWRATRAGAMGLIVALVAAGAVAFVAFDALFEIFHRLLFPGGSYTFDPRTERLVQLFPFQFWQDSAIAVGLLAIVIALLVAIVAHRRMASSASPTAPASAATLERSRP
jgi:integral membrane protein (TIGR01906 family)